MVTGVGLITTYTEKWKENIMAAEWTTHVSFHPPLIMVVVHPAEATHEMILESKEFGVNMAAENQGAIVSLAGSYSRYETDKMSSHMVKTYPAKKIRAPLVEGCVVNAECKLVKRVKLGDHTGFIGEVIEITHNPDKKPIIYHQGRLWQIQDFERAPTLFVTATYMPESSMIKAEGRMRKADPEGKIELFLFKDGRAMAEGTTRIDPRGFYQYEWQLEDTNHHYIVEAKSGNLVATASLRKQNPNLRNSIK